MLFSILLLLSSLVQSPAPQAEADSVVVLSDSLFVPDDPIVNMGTLLTWRFHAGDNMQWADPGFDHSGWVKQSPTGLTEPLPSPLWDDGHGWFRATFSADSSIYNEPWYFYFNTSGAAEVYLDGELLHTYGQFSTDPEEEIRYNPSQVLHPAFNIAPRDTHLIAVRYSFHPAQTYARLTDTPYVNYGFGIGLAKEETNILSLKYSSLNKIVFYPAVTALLFIILLHGFLFYLFKNQKGNLFIAILSGLLLLHAMAVFNFSYPTSLDNFWSNLINQHAFPTLLAGALLVIPYTLVSLFELYKYEKLKYLPWLVLPVYVGYLFFGGLNFTFLAIVIIVLPTTIFLLYRARKMGSKGVSFVAFGFIGFLFSFVGLTILEEYYGFDDYLTLSFFLILLLYVIIPVSMTLFMAYKTAYLYTGLEEIVDERTAALTKSLADLKAAQDQLVQQEKLASLGQLTAGIAHEIKNPLNFVNNFSDLSVELIEEIREELSEFRNQNSEEHAKKKRNNADVEYALSILDDIEANLRKIHEHGTRADRIVKSMLQHSRGGSGKMEPVDVNALVKEYVNLAFHGMRASKDPINVDIKFNLGESVGKVPLIAEDFSRVIVNLCNNAFDAMRDKFLTSSQQSEYQPTLTVKTKQENDRIIVQIKDNGPGISAEIKDKILQPFFTTKKGTQGTGLGLSITHDIIKAHGGTIEVKSREGFSTTFIIILPT